MPKNIKREAKLGGLRHFKMSQPRGLLFGGIWYVKKYVSLTIILSYFTEDPQPRETLLHFAARLGLNRVAAFFIKKPGCEVALTLHNKNGDTPRDVALANKHNSLAELLSE